MAFHGASCDMNLSIFSLKSNTTAIEIINAMAKHISSEELDNVEVEPLQPLPVIRQLYTFYFPVQFSHNLVDTRFTIIGFHVEKSPVMMMCLRASPTSHR